MVEKFWGMRRLETEPGEPFNHKDTMKNLRDFP